MKIVEQDILRIQSGIVCHQVNCQGVMGSGLALAMKEMRKQVFVQYRILCETLNRDPKALLGQAQFMEYGNLAIVNIFGQETYGRRKKHPYTDYNAVKKAFETLRKKISAYGYKGAQVYIPYLMGCDRAGGDWNIYSKIVESEIPNVVACKLPE